ncbi:MAG: hypothetical protein BWY32_03816 [bacterium ADurb.Bin243]|nr:MAG: hypothetical protein BWY32_03816 [bacterium ADurb.Bin243]
MFPGLQRRVDDQRRRIYPDARSRKKTRRAGFRSRGKRRNADLSGRQTRSRRENRARIPRSLASRHSRRRGRSPGRRPGQTGRSPALHRTYQLQRGPRRNQNRNGRSAGYIRRNLSAISPFIQQAVSRQRIRSGKMGHVAPAARRRK